MVLFYHRIFVVAPLRGAFPTIGNGSSTLHGAFLTMGNGSRSPTGSFPYYRERFLHPAWSFPYYRESSAQPCGKKLLKENLYSRGFAVNQVKLEIRFTNYDFRLA